MYMALKLHDFCFIVVFLKVFLIEFKLSKTKLDTGIDLCWNWRGKSWPLFHYGVAIVFFFWQMKSHLMQEKNFIQNLPSHWNIFLQLFLLFTNRCHDLKTQGFTFRRKKKYKCMWIGNLTVYCRFSTEKKAPVWFSLFPFGIPLENGIFKNLSFFTKGP